MVHVFLILLLLWQPILIDKLTNKVSNKYYQYQKSRDYKKLTQGHNMTVAQEIVAAFTPWQAQDKVTSHQGLIFVNQTPFSELTDAINSLQHGDTLLIAEGIYRTPMVIRKHHITIKGNGHVVFEKSAAHGKGFILSQGNNLTVENIECRHISVRDGNGACIRQEGKNLTLNHVYFHNSQEGILETSQEAGFIKISDSRFERLGYNGQAHALYTNKADIFVYQSLFIATKNQGHAIKVRGGKLIIDSSILISLSSDDSRLIDMPNGGELSVKNSILAQGPMSVNGQVIGFGLEGITHLKNSIKLTDNLIYLERLGTNVLLAWPKNSADKKITTYQSKNIVIGVDSSDYQSESNNYFSNRSELGLPSFPYLPISFCKKLLNCPINTFLKP